MLLSSYHPRSWRAGGRQNPSESKTKMFLFRCRFPSKQTDCSGCHFQEPYPVVAYMGCGAGDSISLNTTCGFSITLQGLGRTDDDEDGRQLKAPRQSLLYRAEHALRLEKSFPASDTAGITLRAPLQDRPFWMFGLCRSWSSVWVASGPMSADAWKSKAQRAESCTCGSFV